MQTGSRHCFLIKLLLSQRHVKHHHQGKSHGKRYGSDIRVLPLAHFRNQLFDYHVQHGTCSKSLEIRKERNYVAYRHNRQECTDGFHDTGKASIQKCFSVAYPFCPQRQGNNSALRKILDRNAPSGILCSVTANTSFTVRDRELDMPSDSLLSLCRWGMM